METFDTITQKMKQNKQDADFDKCLAKFNELRKWMFMNNINSFAFRQALIHTFDVDTWLAVNFGKHTVQALVQFDALAHKDAQMYIKLKLPEEIAKMGMKKSEF